MSKKYKKIFEEYDLDEINAQIDVCDVIDYFGISMNRKGGKVQVLCPFHDDQHFGSAEIYKNKIYCHVENRSFDSIDIYQEMAGVSKYEAIKAVAEMCGCTKSERKVDKFPFSKQELKMIGLFKDDRNKEMYPKNVIMGKTKMLHLYKGVAVMRETLDSQDEQNMPIQFSVLYEKGESQMKHLRMLYEEDKSTFVWMITWKCRETYEKQKILFSWLKNLYMALTAMGIPEEREFVREMLYVCAADILNVQKIFQKGKGL